VRKGEHKTTVTETTAAGRKLELTLLEKLLKIKAGDKTVAKEDYKGGIEIAFSPASEVEFTLVLGFRAKKKPIIMPLAAVTRQQRDMLLIALAAFSRQGWLDAALGGNAQPLPYASYASHAIEVAANAAEGGAGSGTAEEGGSLASGISRRSILLAAGGAFGRSNAPNVPK